jgi:hypothetical protein
MTTKKWFVDLILKIFQKICGVRRSRGWPRANKNPLGPWLADKELLMAPRAFALNRLALHNAMAVNGDCGLND